MDFQALSLSENVFNPYVQQEIFDLIEKIYFKDFINRPENEEENEYINVAEFEIKKLNLEKLDRNELKNTIVKLQIQRDVVGRKLSDVIFKNSQAYSQELQRISDLKLLLEDSYQLCSILRRSILMSKLIFILPSLNLIKKQIKKLYLIKLLKSIQAINGFQNTSSKIIELINEKEFPSAINMCIKSDHEMEKYQHFKCIKSLKISQRDFYNLINESLDVNILKICRQFDETMYRKILLTYNLLDKIDHLFQRLNANFTSTIHLVCTETIINVIIRKFIGSNNSKNDLSRINSYLEDLKRQDYSQLIKLVDVESYKSSLVELSCNLWNVMKNYYKTFLWTKNNYIYNGNTNGLESLADFFTEIQKKLLGNAGSLWQEIQQKVGVFFGSMNFENYKFDDFIEILMVVNKFIDIGEEFSNNNSNSLILIKTTRDQTLAYFKSYHLSHLEELKMFLENETWQLCPVIDDFSILKLNEYKFLKEKSPESSIVFKEYHLNESSDQVNKEKSFEISSNMNRLLQIENPFEINNLKNNNNNANASNNNNGHHDSQNDEKSTLMSFDVPIVTYTSLNIIRLFGKYIHMLSIFKIISTEVISYLMQLFYFYLFYVYHHFVNEELDLASNSPIKVIISKIKEELFSQSKFNFNEPMVAAIRTLRNRRDYLDCINQRVIASESLVFLSKQLQELFPLILNYLPNENEKQLDSYLNIIKETPKIRNQIYFYISRVAIDYTQISETITKVNWDLHDILSQHNFYIDVLLKQMQQLISDVESLKMHKSLEKITLNVLMEQCLRLIMRMLVDAYANVRKCSNEGRALMQLDFQQLIVKLEKLCEIRPIPEKDYVEVFIKAFYLPDSSIEKWIKEHPEYSQKNLILLVNIMAQLTKKTRSNLISSLENSISS